jgi:hypothetical protein
MPRGKPKVSGGGAEANGVNGNKMEAVRRALTAMGRDAKPKDLRGYIQREFKLDIQPNHISSYKSTILNKGGAGARKGGKSKGAAGDAAAGVSIKDLKTVQDLKRRLGAGRVRELLELLA